MIDKDSRVKAFIALVLLVPAPSLGVLFGMFLFPDSALGKSLFLLTKIWLFALPALWLKFIDKSKFSASPVKKGGIVTGIFSGAIIIFIIVGGFFIVGDKLIDKDFFVTKLALVGLTNPWLYLGAMMYWILINSVLEEYVWRWFCLEKCAALTSRFWAVFLSAAFFTLHHIFAMVVYFSPVTVLVCAFGVFIVGLIWSAMYLRYQSIFPGYISHVFADIAVFCCGAWILFG